ncbi:MAG: GIY-YIG nuclease family protein [Candidatus Niyogibacteria bacterium]|nr:GIY-YIG nuclease family protein [Candidatus Niyogibacteria bacterium]
MFYVYILQSLKDKQLYIGYSEDLKRRIQEHDSGKNKSTKYRRPFRLVYYEAYQSKMDAQNRETNLKLFGRALGGLKRRIKISLNP